MDEITPIAGLNLGSAGIAPGPTPVSIGQVQFDALLEITEKFDANVPMIRTDSGYETSDDIIPGFMKVDMTLFVTPTPVTWRSIPSHNLRNPREVVDSLKELLEKRKPVFVSTVKKNYENMMIEKITASKTADNGYALEIKVSMIQLTIAPYTESVMYVVNEFSPSTNIGQTLTVGSEDGVPEFFGPYFDERDWT